jgi:hypothetical protein
MATPPAAGDAPPRLPIKADDDHGAKVRDFKDRSQQIADATSGSKRQPAPARIVNVQGTLLSVPEGERGITATGIQAHSVDRGVTFRAARIEAGNYHYVFTQREQTPGGQVIVQIEASGRITVPDRTGNSVEYQKWGPYRGNLPSTTFGEGVTSKGLTGSISKTFAFSDKRGADAFIANFLKSHSKLSDYLTVYGEFEKAYDAAFDHDARAINDKDKTPYHCTGVKGGAESLGIELSGKDYVSVTPIGIISPFGSNATPGNAVLGLLGGYLDAGGSLGLKAGTTYSDPKLGQAVNVDVLDNPGAPQSIYIQGTAAWRILGVASLATWVPMGLPAAYLNEGSNTAGGGINLNYGVASQAYGVFEYEQRKLDPQESQFYRDGRYSWAPQIGKPSIRAVTATFNSFGINISKIGLYACTDFEATPVDTLTELYRASLEAASPRYRFDHLPPGGFDPSLPSTEWHGFDARLISKEWEERARKAYETKVNGGKALTNEVWNGILADSLSRRNWLSLEGTARVPTVVAAAGPLKDWLDTYIRSDGNARVSAYEAWDKSIPAKVEQRRKELQQMTADQIYVEYPKYGLRIPALHLTVTKGHRDDTSLRVAVTSHRGESVRAPENPGFSPHGFWSVAGNETVDDTVQTATYALVDWKKGLDILSDPVAGKAFAAVYNQRGYPLPATLGEGADPRSMLPYYGRTNTQAIYKLQQEVLKKNPHALDWLSEIPGIYRIATGDYTDNGSKTEVKFEDIARRALDKLGRHTDNADKIRAYADRIKDLNFGYGPREGEIFTGATIFLPTPDLPGSFAESDFYRILGGGALSERARWEISEIGKAASIGHDQMVLDFAQRNRKNPIAMHQLLRLIALHDKDSPHGVQVLEKAAEIVRQGTNWREMTPDENESLFKLSQSAYAAQPDAAASIGAKFLQFAAQHPGDPLIAHGFISLARKAYYDGEGDAVVNLLLAAARRVMRDPRLPPATRIA